MLQNIPHPVVTTIQGHSYVSMKQYLCKFQSLEHYPALITNNKNKVVTKNSDSKTANEVMKRVGNENPNVLSQDIVVVLATQ